MKKYIEISEETLNLLMEGKRVEGSLRVDEVTNKLAFRAYNRLSRMRRSDRTVVQLENGWLKESAQRYKFFNSIRKDVGVTKVSVAMHRELGTAMEELKLEKIMNFEL